MTAAVHPARHLLRAKDLADARYREPLDVATLAGAAYLSAADICFTVGLRSVGSFSTSFGRVYGLSPTAYREARPPAATYARIPTCVLQAYGRPSRNGEDRGDTPG